MSVDFAQLQMLSLEAGDGVAEAREKLDQISAIFRARPEHRSYLELMSYLRDGFPVSALEQADVLCVDYHDTPSMLPEELHHDSLGFVRESHLVFRGRYVYPVKDTKGHVAGWCGWDPFETPKYLDSTNYGYSAKNALFYGAECLPSYYRSEQPVIVTEGIACCLYLRYLGFQALASLGSVLSPYMVTVLKRFGRRAIIIPDADEAGNKYREQVRRSLPMAKCLQSHVAKDIDDTRKKCPELKDELTIAIQPFGRSKIFS